MSTVQGTLVEGKIFGCSNGDGVIPLVRWVLDGTRVGLWGKVEADGEEVTTTTMQCDNDGGEKKTTSAHREDDSSGAYLQQWQQQQWELMAMATARKVDGSVRQQCDLSGATAGSSLFQQHNGHLRSTFATTERWIWHQGDKDGSARTMVVVSVRWVLFPIAFTLSLRSGFTVSVWSYVCSIKRDTLGSTMKVGYDFQLGNEGQKASLPKFMSLELWYHVEERLKNKR